MSDPQQNLPAGDSPADSTGNPPDSTIPSSPDEEKSNLLASAEIGASISSLNSVASSRASAATHKSGIRPPSKIGVLHGAKPKTQPPAVPASPSSNEVDDPLKKMIDEFGRHRLTDVLEEDGEEDQSGRASSRNGSVNRKRYSSSSPASSMDALWELHSHRLSEAGLSRHSDSSAILTEDTDAFIIGQRVWVGGNKPGHIAFIGDTTFAPGEWAGIALDEPIGKNDGSVGGTRYFMCEPKKGVFCRLTRLTRSPLPNSGEDYNTPSPHTGSHKMLAMSPSPTESHRSMLKSPVSLFGSNTSLSSAQVDYKLGDRVIIKSGQGSKVGTVRYMGVTEFAKGEWVGVELDEPRGKNDGSVNGIRYFDCQPHFGIFAPISKVSKSPSNVKPNHCQLHSPGGLPPSGLRRANSKESITSNLSMMSSASAAPRRVRLGITSLSSKKLPTSTPSTTSRTQVAARTAWQEVLDEKQKHIEQLLKEKDLDRAEATRAASQAEEAERKLLLSNQEFAKYRDECGAQLHKHLQLLSELKENRKELMTQLEDEKKKNEDWQFKYEEAEVTRADIQARLEMKGKECDTLIKEQEKLKMESQEEFKNVLEEMRQAKDIQADINNVMFDLQRHMQTAQQDLEEVEKERDELQNSLASKQSEVDSLRKELSDTVAAKDESSAKNAGELEEKLETIKNLDNALIQQKEEFNKIVNELVEQHKKALDEKDSNISQIKSVIADKAEDISHLNTKISELESIIIDKNVEFEKLKSEMEHVLEKGKADAELIGNLNAENKNNNLLVVETNLRQELDNIKLKLENATEKLNKKTADTENLIQEKNSIASQLEAKTNELNQVQNELLLKTDILEKKRILESTLKEQVDEAKVLLTSEVAALVADRDDLRNSVENLEENLDRANIAVDEISKLVIEKDNAITQLKELQNILYDKFEKNKKEQIRKITEELEQMNIALASALAEESKIGAEKDAAIAQLKEHQKMLNDKLEKSEKEVKTKSEEIAKLTEELKQITNAICVEDEHECDSTTGTSMEEALERLKTHRLRVAELEKQLAEFESEKELLSSEIQRSSTQINELCKEKAQLMLEAEKVKADSERVIEEQAEKIKTAESGFENKINEINRKWEADVIDLQAEIQTLKDQLEKTKQTTATAIAGTSGSVINPEDTPEYKKLLEDKANSDAQLEFVNSIIADMLKKNEEHLMRIELLEQGYNPQEAGREIIREKYVAPRKYCDICEEFDQHETEDCSKQESADPPSNAELGKKKKEKPPPRPYCTICEEFGHDTADCTVSQEF